MAYRITQQCTACALCLGVCPNHAISAGGIVPRIIRLLCTECVGYSEEPQCVAVCPSNAIQEDGGELEAA
jgi:Fe-S-cluster-containing hydrogenase component 2